MQYIAQEFIDMIDKLEKVTGKDVSHYREETGIIFRFSEPDDETAAHDIEIFVQWYEFNDLDIDGSIEMLKSKLDDRR